MERKRHHVLAAAAAAGAATAAFACSVMLTSCRQDRAGRAADAAPRPLLVDATAGSGVDFVHQNGATPQRLLPETMGSGVAVFDADGDGRADLLFADGARLDEPRQRRPLSLFRNLGGWRFERVEEGGGLVVDFYAMGLAIGDIDGDGDLDVLVTGVGGDRLFANDGTGHFDDVSERWGLAPDEGFGSSAAFLDAEGDGDLDLFVGRYVRWQLGQDVACSPDGQHRVYCTPEVYDGSISRFYRNEGDRLVEATAESGIAVPGKALGVVVLDVENDQNLDLAVANDTEPNFLFVNRGDGTFDERGVLSGFAVGDSGAARGGMGIAASDLDGDGASDLVIGNFANEMAALFRAEDGGLFRDVAAEVKLGMATLLRLAFGTLALDLDGDGRDDVVFANGHIEPEIAEVSGDRQTFAQPLQVFLGTAEGFVETPAADASYVGRGLAAGDLDGDGDPDLVLTQNGGPALLLRNDAPPRPWLRVRLCGPGANTWGLGAEVTLETSIGRTLVRRLEPSGSYLSSSEPILAVGLEPGETAERAAVRWPGGASDAFHDLGVVEHPAGAHELTLRAETSSACGL